MHKVSGKGTEREKEWGWKEGKNLHLTLFCLSKIRPRPFYIAEQDDKTLTAASMKRDIDYWQLCRKMKKKGEVDREQEGKKKEERKRNVNVLYAYVLERNETYGSRILFLSFDNFSVLYFYKVISKIILINLINYRIIIWINIIIVRNKRYFFFLLYKNNFDFFHFNLICSESYREIKGKKFTNE